MKSSTKIAKEAGTNILGEMYGGAARFAFIGFLARFVGPEFLGIYSIGNAITRIFGVLGMAGLDRGILRFVSHNIGKGNSESIKIWIRVALKYGLIFGLCATFFQFIFSEYIANNFYNGNKAVKDTISLFSLILIFSIVSGIAAHSTQGFKILKYKVLTIQVVQPTILLITLISLYNLEYSNFYQITIPLLIAEVIGFLVMFKFLQKVNTVKLLEIIKQPLDSKLIRFSFPLMMVGLLGMIMHWIDILMLGYFLPPEEVGIYQPAVRTTGIIRLFLVSFSGIFTPMISEFLAKSAFKEMNQIYKLTCRWMITLAVPFFIVVISRSEQIMLLFGEQYIVGANLLFLLMLGMFFQAIGNPAGSTLVMAGKTKLVLFNTIIISALNVSINIIFIPKFGLMGAAWGTAISLILLCIIRIIQIWYFYKLHPFELKILKSIITGIFIYVIIIFFQKYINNFYYFIDLILTTSFVFLLYFTILYLLKLEKEDLEVIDSIKLKLKGQNN